MRTRSHRRGISSTARIIGAGLVGVAAGAANLAPVPYLSPAVALVFGILKLCQQVGANK